MGITNPPRAGDLIDFSDTNHCRLIVNSEIVSLGSPYWNLLSLGITYDGKELTFTEIPTPHVGHPTYANEQSVELQMDLTGADSGRTTYFRGRIKKRTHDGRNKDAIVTYLAIGLQQLADEVTLFGFQDMPLYQKFAGTSIYTIINTVKVYGDSIANAITDVFTFNATRLSSAGIPTDLGSPGPSEYPSAARLNRDLSIQNQGFYSGLKQICDYFPQRKPYLDHTQQKWIFPDVLNVPLETVQIDSVNLPEHAYTFDTANRYTAVRLKAQFDGRITVPFKGTATCVKGWDEALEADWCMQKAARDAANALPDGDGYTFVYRKWLIPVDEAEINPNAPYGAVATFDYHGETKYQALDAYIDIHEGVIVTKSPVVKRGNAWDAGPGGAIGPDGVTFTWYRLDSAPGSKLIDIRRPASSYEGTAYTLFGLESEKVEVVDATQATTVNAQAKLDVLKDVIIAGTVPLEGDPIPELINLQKRLLFKHSSNTTGIESIPCIITGYTYHFGKRGRSEIAISTDVSGLIKVN